MDLNYLVNQIKGETNIPYVRIRQGFVQHYNSATKTIDVQIAGDPAILPSVKYLHSYSPQTGDTIWLLSWGSDLLGLGNIAV